MLTLLRNCELFTPDRVGRRDVLIAGGGIEWIGADAPALDPAYATEEHDVAGMRVIPGLIDGHAHLIGGGGESGYASRVPPVPLGRFTTAGITTAVGVLGTDDVTRTTASLVAQARGLCEEGLSAWCHTGGYHVPPVTLTGGVRDDIVHIDRIIGVGEIALSDHRSSQPTLDELLRIAADAHVAGMMTGKAGIVHLHMGDGQRGLDLVRRALETSEIPPRVFNPTHCNRRRELFDEALALAERGVTIDLTAYPEVPGGRKADDLSAADALLTYLGAGLPPQRVTVSSDGGGCLPIFDADGALLHMDVGDPRSLAQTLGTLLAGGADLASILPAFTRNVASLLRLHTKGRIAPGQDADLVVLDDDGGIRDVMAMGRWHVRNGEQIVRGRFEEPANGRIRVSESRSL